MDIEEKINETVDKISRAKDRLGVAEGTHAARIHECNEVVLGPILKDFALFIYEDITKNKSFYGDSLIEFTVKRLVHKRAEELREYFLIPETSKIINKINKLD
jgi:hypothetical protein